MGLRERFARFMYGRYGTDELNRLYSIVSLAFVVIGIVLRSNLIYLIGLLVLMYSVYRSFSKNVSKMYAQNQKFLTWRYQRIAKWSKWKERFSQRKTHRFFRCPNCRQTVRVPKGRGKIAITCPKCKTEFIKKS